jgi:hypothetical protein
MLTLLTHKGIGILSPCSQQSRMLGRQERAAILLLIGVAAIVICAHLLISSIGNQSFAKPFSATVPDGELVVFEGTVNKIATLNGGHLMILAGNASLFVPAQVAQGMKIQTGDSITAYGVVQTYHAKKEITIGSQRDIHLVPKDRGGI